MNIIVIYLLKRLIEIIFKKYFIRNKKFYKNCSDLFGFIWICMNL
jgi:hypothetical protein